MRTETDHIDTTVFIIERWQDVGHGRLRWCGYQPSARDTGEPQDWSRKGGQSVAPLAYEFSACGDCWQKTGVHGTFDRSLADAMFGEVTRRNDGRFRLAQRHYRIETTTVAQSDQADLGPLALAVYHSVPVSPDDERRLVESGHAERVSILRLTPKGRDLANRTPADSA